MPLFVCHFTVLSYSVSMSNLFEKWGLNENCTDAEVRNQYRRFAQKIHPDKSGHTAENQALFCLLQEEYEVLKTASSRQDYMLSLLAENPFPEESVTSEGFYQPPPVHFSTHNIIPPSVLTAEVSVALKYILKGGQIQMDVPVSYPCPCGRDAHCALCRGTGQLWSHKTVLVRYPPRIHDGATMVFPQQGHRGSLENGDLYVVIRWTKSLGWRSHGDLLEKTMLIPQKTLLQESAYVRMPYGTVGKVRFERERVENGAAVLTVVPAIAGINPEPFAVRIWFKEAQWWQFLPALKQMWYGIRFSFQRKS